MTETTGLVGLQIPSIVVVFLIVAIEFYRLRRVKDTEMSSFLTLLWMLNVILFYTVLMLHNSGVLRLENHTITFTNWSSGLRFQSLITFFTLSLGRLLHWRRLNG